MEAPIFILGCHKSGTSLVRNLLDGSPELFVIPIETHFFEFSGFGVSYALRRAIPKHIKFEQFVEKIEQIIQKSNQKSEMTGTRGGDSLDAGYWNVQVLVGYLHNKGKELFELGDLRGLFNVYVEGLYSALYADMLPDLRYVEKSVEHAEFASFLKSLYPKAKFIHVVRNPYAVLVSNRKFMMKGKKKYPYLGPILESMENNYYYLYQNPGYIPDYMVVKYEDVITETADKMKEVAAFIDIDFSEHLLEPTVLGKGWGGNSMSGKDFQGISNYPLTSWKNDINSLEIELVNKAFSHVLSDYQYAMVEQKSSLLKFLPDEKPSIYLLNRFLRKQFEMKRSK